MRWLILVRCMFTPPLPRRKRIHLTAHLTLGFVKRITSARMQLSVYYHIGKANERPLTMLYYRDHDFDSYSISCDS